MRDLTTERDYQNRLKSLAPEMLKTLKALVANPSFPLHTNEGRAALTLIAKIELD
jgi:hypothetical protein